jgi:proteasome lid subunit RPN8/RPN11
MDTTDFELRLVLSRSDGSALAVARISPDWEPVRQHVWFADVRSGQLRGDEVVRALPVTPLWSPTAGQPFVQGFRVGVEAGGAPRTTDVDAARLAPLGAELARRLTTRAGLSDTGQCSFSVIAEPRATDQSDIIVSPLEVEAASGEPFGDGSLSQRTLGARVVGPADAAMMPAFLAGAVLDETREIVARSGDQETGGILVGHVLRDAAVPEAFVEVTGQIPADHTVSDVASLTFTANTWTAASDALLRRGAGEVMVGWWHSHPVNEWCPECPPGRKRRCNLTAGFLSSKDRLLHRTVFSAPYSVALVLSQRGAGDVGFSLFGWDRGLLTVRGFGVLGSCESLPVRKDMDAKKAPEECDHAASHRRP